MMRHFRELSVAGALVIVLLALAIVAPGFYQPQPLLSLITREAPTLIVACGMALVIICRQIEGAARKVRSHGHRACPRLPGGASHGR